MVSAATRLLSAAGAVLCLVCPLAAKDLAGYRVGDKAEEDIVTPVPLVVMDTNASVALRRKEAERAPVIMQFRRDAADEVEKDFRAAFTCARSNFLRAVGGVFQTSRLEEAALASAQFRSVVTEFQIQNPSFPVDGTLAALWARGDSGQAVAAPWIARLREAMAHPIRTDHALDTFAAGNFLRLVPVTNRDEAMTLATAGRFGTNVAREIVIPLSRARASFQETAPTREALLARYAAASLKPNCIPDSELTSQYLTKRIEQTFAAERYSAGQFICRRGQVIDQKMLAALTMLAERNVASQTPKANDNLPAQPPMAQNSPRTRQSTSTNYGLAAGLAGGALVLAVAVWGAVRRRRRTALLPATVPPGPVATLPHEAWQQRALSAEQRAQQANAALYAGLLPQLANLLKTTLVRGLISQRSSLLDAQQTAAAEMAELERRLDELQAPLQERMRAYEKRIEELEKALAEKGRENRELIQAKIQLAKHQLEAQRTRNRVDFN